MESFNFGAFDPTIGARLANIPQEAQKQQTANMLQAMQMQGAMREGQMSQMKIDEMVAERKEIDAFAANLKARGYTQGSKGFFTELASSRNPTRMQQGFEGLRRLEEQDQFDAYQQRQFAKRTNALAPGAPVNAMLGAPTLADLQDEARALSMLKDPRAKDELAFVREQIKQRTQPRVVAPSGSVVVEGVPTYTAPAAVPAPRQPNLVADRLIPDGQGGFKPNQQLIDIETGLRQAGRPTGATVVMPPLEKTEQQEKGKLNVKIYGDIAATADRARKILPALETSEAILTGGFKTGFGSDVQTQAARVLSVLGVPEADKYATNSQLFLAQGRQALLQRQLEQKGAQSEGDAQRINQTFIQLGNTPEANKFLVATAKAQSKQDIARQKFYSDWWSKSKTYEGAEEAWLDGAGGKSLFDSPDMKQFAPKTQPSDISSAAAAEIARRKGTQR